MQREEQSGQDARGPRNGSQRVVFQVDIMFAGGHHARMRVLQPDLCRPSAEAQAPADSGPFSKQRPQHRVEFGGLRVGMFSSPGDRDLLDAVLAIVVLDVAVLLAEFVDPAGDLDVLLAVFQDLLDAPLTPPAYSLQAIGTLADL